MLVKLIPYSQKIVKTFRVNDCSRIFMISIYKICLHNQMAKKQIRYSLSSWTLNGQKLRKISWPFNFHDFFTLSNDK